MPTVSMPGKKMGTPPWVGGVCGEPGVGGFAAPLLVVGLMQIMGAPLGWSMPLLVSVALGLVGLVLPSLRLHSEADEARRDFRHVVGSYLDLVAMSLSAGRGVPEALDAASSLSDDPAMLRIRDALDTQLVDLIGIYRDALMIAAHAQVSPIHPDMQGLAGELSTIGEPNLLACIEAISHCRDDITHNVRAETAMDAMVGRIRKACNVQ